MARPARSWLTSWTTSSVRIWNALRRSALTVVSDTIGVFESVVSTQRPPAAEARLSVSPRRNNFCRLIFCSWIEHIGPANTHLENYLRFIRINTSHKICSRRVFVKYLCLWRMKKSLLDSFNRLPIFLRTKYPLLVF